MTTRIVECFAVMDHGCDGKAFPGRVVAHFVNEKDAKTVAGNWNGVSPVKLVIHDTMSDYDNHKSVEFKEKALAKLSPEERLVLGL